MKLGTLYKYLRETLSEADARYMIQKRAGLAHADLISTPDQEIDSAQILNDLQRAQAGEPLSRIYKEREFWGLPFSLSEETLDPRQDTETLIDVVLARLKSAPPETILDLGTGSGCILLALLSEFPDAKGLGVDLSKDAITTAKKNAKALNLDSRSTFIESNWGESIDEKFDLVVSNPPYIASNVILNLDENVQKYDPILALDGGEDGLKAYKNIFSGLFRLLKPGGYAFFEIGFDQAESVMRLGKESRFSNISLHRDSAELPRVVEIFFDP